MAKTIERRTAETILQSPLEVKVGDKVYKVAPPCAATLMLASALIPEIPKLDIEGNRLYETLAFAKDCQVTYRIMATLIIGAKAIREEKSRMPKVRRLFLKPQKSSVDVLAEELMYECTNEEVYDIAQKILTEGMGVNDFFGLSASLREISLIQMTRGAGMTVSGQ